MEGYRDIEKKLFKFVRKYYRNELIKGSILFVSFGFLYLFFTLFVEYFLWLQPTARTVLFWLFVLGECYFLFRFIAIPIFKLVGYKEGISYQQSSKIIGDHFPEVSDKLLNIMQLSSIEDHSELLIASIEQKARELRPIPFVNAINFKTNKMYLKYAMAPLLIWLTLAITGNVNVLNNSLERVIQHRTAFVPPAPFSFQLKSEDLTVIQGEEIKVEFEVIGNVRPDKVLIVYNNERYYTQENDGVFSYVFKDTTVPIQFFVTDTNVNSEMFELTIVETPRIQNVSVNLEYPRYLNKMDETIKSFGSLLLPEGTKASWNAQTIQTDSLVFNSESMSSNFSRVRANLFTYEKRIYKSMSYQIASSNAKLRNYETLFFSIEIIKDAFPSIEVISSKDSLMQNTILFAGQISDDYGLRKLELVYYDIKNPSIMKKVDLDISKKDIQSFYFEFPGTLELDRNLSYEMYFQVFDNDAVNGSKVTKSEQFMYQFKSESELEDAMMRRQKNQLQSFEKSRQEQQIQRQLLEGIQKDLQNKSSMNWNDKKNVSSYIQRQESYQKRMQRQTEELKSNLDKLPSDNKSEALKKEELKQRIAELKKLEKEQKLLDELEKVANKLNKDDLLNKVKKLTEQNKQQERSLERVLELTKRFYVEQKTNQIKERLNQLSKQQDSLSKLNDWNKESQSTIKKDFEAIKKELESLEKDNDDLKNPMQMPSLEEEQNEVNEQFEAIDQKTTPKQRESQKKNQKNASNSMQRMSDKIQSAMMADSASMNEENIETLRLILENLLKYSFLQEDLMTRFEVIDVSHPTFGKEIKAQNMLKSYFEHIDDSLYVLSMRLPQISVNMQKDLEKVHFYTDQSLENFSENKFGTGLSNQQYVLTSVNNLADMLSTVLDNLQNPKISMPGQGKKGGESFSLPDIIRKQGELLEQMKKGLKPGGNKQGKKSGNPNEGTDNQGIEGDLYRIYQEQAQLRAALENARKKMTNRDMKTLDKLLNDMKSLENDILEKSYDPKTIAKMQQLKFNMLKLDNAMLKQRQDTKRKSNVNTKKYEAVKSKFLQEKLFYNQLEILNRQSLPLQNNYKRRVRKYFEKSDNVRKDD